MGKSLKAYYNTPKLKSGRRMGVVVVHDIFGFNLPNGKYIVDHLASKGYDAVMPDFYAGKDEVTHPSGWPATETKVEEPLEGDAFGKFWTGITGEAFLEKFKSDVEDTTAFLRRKGCIRFAIIGFCWGGYVAEIASMTGRFAATVSAHGCMHTDETYKQVKGSILYISVKDDAFFGKDNQDKITDAGGKVKVFEGMTHGFMVRGDYSDSKVKAAADEGMADIELLLSNACLRKPKYSKLGSLNPDSHGITSLVKVMSEPQLVEEPRRSGGSSQFHEVTVGDETAQAILSLKEFQIEGLVKDKVICVRNASVRMVKGFVRIVVDKWGKLDKEVEGSVEEVGSKNVSTTEYELVTG